MLTTTRTRAKTAAAGPRGNASRLARATAAMLAALAIVAADVLAGGLPGGASARAAAFDSIRDSQSWVLNMLDAQAAWQRSEGAGVTVAVIDSGVDPNVSDLTGSVTDGPDLTGLSTPPGNANWGVHGTWMASVIAGHGHGGGDSGIIGIAPESRILSIRVIPEKGDPGYKQYNAEPEQRIQQALATGIRDAVNRGAQVISMSLGYTAPSAVVRAAAQYAFDRGVVLVASSGNSGEDDVHSRTGLAPVSFPAEYPGVLSVAALKPDGSVAGFSSNNLSVRVGAPGDNVPAQGRDGNYWLVSGTSPACALVAGVAALIKSAYRGLSSALVLKAITATARNVPSGSYNAKTGFGAVDAAAALNEAGVLAGTRPAGSKVTDSAHFGGGPSAVATAPVAARGTGSLVLFGLLALLSLVVAGWAGMRVLASRRALASAAGGTNAGYFGPPGDQYPRYSGGYPGPGGYPRERNGFEARGHPPRDTRAPQGAYPTRDTWQSQDARSPQGTWPPRGGGDQARSHRNDASGQG